MSAKIIKEALIISMARELEDLPLDQDLNQYHKFSQEFENKMKRLSRKVNRKYVDIVGFKIRRSIAAAASIIVILAASMSVEAIRLPVIRITEKIYDKFSEIIFDKKEDVIIPERIEEYYEPGYIPKGYSVTDEAKNILMNLIVYTNDEDKKLFFQQFTFNASIAVDTEGISTKKIMINGNEGLIFTKKGLTSIVFNDGRYGYYISGYESQETIIKIAESILISN